MANISGNRKVKEFVDISLAFQPNPVTGDLSVLRNERAIDNSVKNIIMIIPGEVPFNRDMGSMVSEYLFDLVDESTAGLLMLEVDRAIRFNEPRVEVLEVVVEAQPEQYQFVVRVTYKIVGYDQVYTFSNILRPTRS